MTLARDPKQWGVRDYMRASGDIVLAAAATIAAHAAVKDENVATNRCKKDTADAHKTPQRQATQHPAIENSGKCAPRLPHFQGFTGTAPITTAEATGRLAGKQTNRQAIRHAGRQ